MSEPRTDPAAVGAAEAELPPVVFENVSCVGARDSAPLFTGLSFTLARGEALVLTGAIGRGKSTALRLALGAGRPSRGQVRIWGKDPARLNRDENAELRQRIGYVAQSGALISNLTLFENLVLPLRYHREPPEEEVRQAAETALALVGIEKLPEVIPPLANRHLQRRVALARALILQPELLILDAPTDGFDERSAVETWLLLKEMTEMFELSVLAATNDADEAAACTERFVHLSAPAAPANDTSLAEVS